MWHFMGSMPQAVSRRFQAEEYWTERRVGPAKSRHAHHALHNFPAQMTGSGCPDVLAAFPERSNCTLHLVPLNIKPHSKSHCCQQSWRQNTASIQSLVLTHIHRDFSYRVLMAVASQG
eukprot:1159718-Pelagomonas_calceolata.AAC.8